MRGLDRWITGNYGEDQFGADQPCEVCGNFPEQCICPVCPSCGEQGSPGCYIATDTNHSKKVTCGGLVGKMTVEQKIAKQRFVVADLKLQWQEAQQYLDYLEHLSEDVQ